MLEAPKHTGQSAADSDEKCYDCRSIFPTPRIGQCYLGDIQDLLGELGNAGQSRSLCMTPTGHQYGNGDFDIEVNDDLVDIQDKGGLEVLRSQLLMATWPFKIPTYVQWHLKMTTPTTRSHRVWLGHPHRVLNLDLLEPSPRT